jgi:hypothetical protein
VEDWRGDKEGVLLVVLNAEVIGGYNLRLTYEAPAKGKASVPIVRAIGVERERGFIGVIAVANVEIAGGDVTGATAIDVQQLPGQISAMTNQPILLAYRYVGVKPVVPLAIKRHKEVSVLVTIVDSAMLTGMQLSDGRRMTKVVYSVRNNRNQFLRLTMPPGADIWSVSVSGNTVSPAAEGENVLIPLVRSASSARELSAFPVEIVFVETPSEAPPSKGKFLVNLPRLDVPIMHVMFSMYLPAEGRYTLPSGLFGARSGFSGPMRVVDKFTSLSAGPGAAVIKRDSAKQAKQLQQAARSRVEAAARAVGARPIRVRLPVNGKLFRLEKILALPGDKLYFQVRYSGWDVSN